MSKFLAAIEKREIRAEFEEYLMQNYKHFSERESLYDPYIYFRFSQISAVQTR